MRFNGPPTSRGIGFPKPSTMQFWSDCHPWIIAAMLLTPSPFAGLPEVAPGGYPNRLLGGALHRFSASAEVDCNDVVIFNFAPIYVVQGFHDTQHQFTSPVETMTAPAALKHTVEIRSTPMKVDLKSSARPTT